MSAGVRVEQKLVGIEAVTGFRFERAVHPESVERPRADVGHVAMKDLIGQFRKLETVGLAPAFGVEQANVDAGGVCRKE